MSKPMQYLVIHCTATPEGREVSAAEIRRWHTAPVSQGGRGWKQVGYTDMVHLDGRVERLVDNNEDAQVDAWEVTNGAAGYNNVSRHIVYVGGCNKAGKPKDTRTEAQREALKHYVEDFHARFPQVKIVGHHELNPGKACPSFDVPTWLRSIGIRQV
ncbi:N-acetylmuramoyl-L-alanine amidase [Segatella oulorum]|uniref:N-acetylmuramoyl-L-alanine amidase n=1 Tax=Segatella oulorum TaxID=28136 RepID=A0A1T4QXM3_9BACT|nr:N-acetylmuramoyl-L-alanine amidase [Segatella oulorum]SKA08406.1 N-acetylmuramoyl-L-alanine amidase [Segatella oulorum]